MAETRHLIAVPLTGTLLGSDVEVGPIGIQRINLVGGKQTTTVSCCEGREDFTGAEVFSRHAVALQAEVENIAHHGDRRIVDAVDPGGPPWLKPGVVGDVIAQHTLVLRSHVRHRVDQGNITDEGRWESVGGVVRGARCGCSVEVNKDPTVQGENKVVCVGSHAQDVRGRRVTCARPVVGLNVVSVRIHFFDNWGAFHGKEKCGCSL